MIDKVRPDLPRILATTQNTKQERFNRTWKKEEYSIGELVLLKEAKKRNKLTQQYTGLHKVLRKLSPLNYDLELCTHGKLVGDVVHVAQFKKYNVCTDNRRLNLN